MSSDDVQHALTAYAQYLSAILKPLIIALACETVFYVLSILSFAVSTYILARKGFKTRAILIMWITTFIMFAVSTCHFVLRWGRLMRTIMNDFEDSSDNGITVELASFMNLYIPAINYLLSDGIVLWRVWIMWGRSVKVLIFSVLFSLGSAVGVIVYISFHEFTVGLAAIYASTLVTNIIATTLMAVKAWQHRRLIRSHLNSTQYRSQVGSVLALLVESGTFYCVIWITIFVSWCVVHSEYFNPLTPPTHAILPGITVQVSGIYPTAVITLAALHRTTWDMSVGKDMSQNAPHAEMRFVTRTVRSGTSTTQTGHHHPTPTIDEGPYPHASEIAARDGEV